MTTIGVATAAPEAIFSHREPQLYRRVPNSVLSVVVVKGGYFSPLLDLNKKPKHGRSTFVFTQRVLLQSSVNGYGEKLLAGRVIFVSEKVITER